jgi:hypothetical protein
VITTERFAHYYLPNPARPFYETPYADSRKGMRPVTISDARKMGALPSFSTVTSIIEKPNLTEWKYQLLLEAADDVISQKKGNVLDHYEEVIELFNERREEAAKKGSAIHDAIEMSVRLAWGLQMDTPVPDVNPGVDTKIVRAALEFLDDLNIRVDGVEVVFADPKMGLGGRVDLVGMDPAGTPVLVDWKTTNTKGKKKLFYEPEMPAQLAVYGEALFPGQETRLFNVVLSRDAPGERDFSEWPERRATDAKRWFMSLFAFWIQDKGYDPRWEV